MRWILPVAALLLVSAAGCGRTPSSEQALRKQAVAADPAFAKVLDRRDDVADRLRVISHELTLKQNQIEGRVAQLQKELNEAKTQATRKIRETRESLQPDEARLRLALSLSADDDNAKQHQRDSVSRSVSRLRKALKDHKAGWSDGERGRMDGELADLLAELKRLDQEMRVLKEHRKLLKIKLDLLRVQ